MARQKTKKTKTNKVATDFWSLIQRLEPSQVYILVARRRGETEPVFWLHGQWPEPVRAQARVLLGGTHPLYADIEPLYILRVKCKR